MGPGVLTRSTLILLVGRELAACSALGGEATPGWLGGQRRTRRREYRFEEYR